MKVKGDYDRYYLLRGDGDDIEPTPFIRISESSSDKFEVWKKGFSKLYMLSQKYYSSPFYDFLILFANPKHMNEWEIPDGEMIRIPFPIERAKGEYEAVIKRRVEM